jgi:phage/plasmid-associated DNA primase
MRAEENALKSAAQQAQPADNPQVQQADAPPTQPPSLETPQDMLPTPNPSQPGTGTDFEQEAAKASDISLVKPDQPEGVAAPTLAQTIGAQTVESEPAKGVESGKATLAQTVVTTVEPEKHEGVESGKATLAQTIGARTVEPEHAKGIESGKATLAQTVGTDAVEALEQLEGTVLSPLESIDDGPFQSALYLDASQLPPSVSSISTGTVSGGVPNLPRKSEVIGSGEEEPGLQWVPDRIKRTMAGRGVDGSHINHWLRANQNLPKEFDPGKWIHRVRSACGIAHLSPTLAGYEEACMICENVERSANNKDALLWSIQYFSKDYAKIYAKTGKVVQTGPIDRAALEQVMRGSNSMISLENTGKQGLVVVDIDPQGGENVNPCEMPLLRALKSIMIHSGELVAMPLIMLTLRGLHLVFRLPPGINIKTRQSQITKIGVRAELIKDAQVGFIGPHMIPLNIPVLDLLPYLPDALSPIPNRFNTPPFEVTGLVAEGRRFNTIMDMINSGQLTDPVLVEIFHDNFCVGRIEPDELNFLKDKAAKRKEKSIKDRKVPKVEITMTELPQGSTEELRKFVVSAFQTIEKYTSDPDWAMLSKRVGHAKTPMEILESPTIQALAFSMDWSTLAKPYAQVYGPILGMAYALTHYCHTNMRYLVYSQEAQEWYFYESHKGVWVRIDQDKLEPIIFRLAQGLYIPGTLPTAVTSKVIDELRVRVSVPNWGHRLSSFAFKDGTLVVGVPGLQSHDPEYQTLTYIETEAQADTKLSKRTASYFANLCGRTPHGMLLLRLFLHAGLYNLSSPQNFMYIQGPPNSGKSLLVNLLAHIFGEDAVHRIKASDNRERFALSGTSSNLKIITIEDADETNTNESMISFIKELSTRGTLQVEVKYSNKRLTRTGLLVVVICNLYPYTQISAAALERRQIMIQSLQVPGERKNTNLLNEIKANTSGICQWITSTPLALYNVMPFVASLNYMHSNVAWNSVSEFLNETKGLYRVEGAWTPLTFIQADSVKHTPYKHGLYTDYEAWCEKGTIHKNRKFTLQAFRSVLEELAANVYHLPYEPISNSHIYEARIGNLSRNALWGVSYEPDKAGESDAPLLTPWLPFRAAALGLLHPTTYEAEDGSVAIHRKLPLAILKELHSIFKDGAPPEVIERVKENRRSFDRVFSEIKYKELRLTALLSGNEVLSEPQTDETQVIEDEGNSSDNTAGVLREPGEEARIGFMNIYDMFREAAEKTAQKQNGYLGDQLGEQEKRANTLLGDEPQRRYVTRRVYLELSTYANREWSPEDEAIYLLDPDKPWELVSEELKALGDPLEFLWDGPVAVGLTADGVHPLPDFAGDPSIFTSAEYSIERDHQMRLSGVANPLTSDLGAAFFIPAKEAAGDSDNAQAEEGEGSSGIYDSGPHAAAFAEEPASEVRPVDIQRIRKVLELTSKERIQDPDKNLSSSAYAAANSPFNGDKIPEEELRQDTDSIRCEAMNRGLIGRKPEDIVLGRIVYHKYVVWNALLRYNKLNKEALTEANFLYPRWGARDMTLWETAINKLTRVSDGKHEAQTALGFLAPFAKETGINIRAARMQYSRHAVFQFLTPSKVDEIKSEIIKISDSATLREWAAQQYAHDWNFPKIEPKTFKMPYRYAKANRLFREVFAKWPQVIEAPRVLNALLEPFFVKAFLGGAVFATTIKLCRGSYGVSRGKKPHFNTTFYENNIKSLRPFAEGYSTDPNKDPGRLQVLKTTYTTWPADFRWSSFLPLAMALEKLDIHLWVMDVKGCHAYFYASLIPDVTPFLFRTFSEKGDIWKAICECPGSEVQMSDKPYIKTVFYAGLNGASLRDAGSILRQLKLKEDGSAEDEAKKDFARRFIKHPVFKEITAMNDYFRSYEGIVYAPTCETPIERFDITTEKAEGQEPKITKRAASRKICSVIYSSLELMIVHKAITAAFNYCMASQIKVVPVQGIHDGFMFMTVGKEPPYENIAAHISEVLGSITRPTLNLDMRVTVTPFTDPKWHVTMAEAEEEEETEEGEGA